MKTSEPDDGVKAGDDSADVITYVWVRSAAHCHRLQGQQATIFKDKVNTHSLYYYLWNSAWVLLPQPEPNDTVWPAIRWLLGK